MELTPIIKVINSSISICIITPITTTTIIITYSSRSRIYSNRRIGPFRMKTSIRPSRSRIRLISCPVIVISWSSWRRGNRWQSIMKTMRVPRGLSRRLTGSKLSSATTISNLRTTISSYNSNNNNNSIIHNSSNSSNNIISNSSSIINNTTNNSSNSNNSLNLIALKPWRTNTRTDLKRTVNRVTQCQNRTSQMKLNIDLLPHEW